MSIKNLRLQKGWSQEQLASEANLSTRTIQRLEKDNKGSLESLTALAKAFEMHFDEFKVLINRHDETTNKIENDEPIFFDKKVKKFLIINLMLFSINIFTSSEHLWFLYPLLGWGIPLFYKKYKSIR